MGAVTGQVEQSDHVGINPLHSDVSQANADVDNDSSGAKSLIFSTFSLVEVFLKMMRNDFSVVKWLLWH